MEMIWVLIVYSSAAITVSFLAQQGYWKRSPIKIKLLLYNSQPLLEWTIRLLVKRSYMENRPIQITVYDFGSTDSTQKILDIFHRQHDFMIDSIHEVEQDFTVSTEQDISYISVSSMVIDLRTHKREFHTKAGENKYT